MTHLMVNDVHLSFGGIHALNGISLGVSEAEIVAIVGPNGAGKSSLLNAVSGVYVPHQGSIQFEGKSILGRKPHDIARLGIARTFQNLGLFAGLNVIETLLLGRHVHMRSGLLAGGLYWGLAQREDAAQRKDLELLVEMLELHQVRDRNVSTLSYGIQKRVELGRALAQQPRLLLLDEPMAGMNRHEKDEMARSILEVQRRSGVTVVMIEHDLGVVMQLAQRVYVLDFGKLIAAGSPAAIQADAAVIRAYLGEEGSRADGLRAAG
jgi:branched-chain amino acid transport system ATP-binding protein